eukprot:2505175-Lingulodinium_polyedra.AAC.1
MAANTGPPSSSTQPHTVYSAPSSAQHRSRAAIGLPRRGRARRLRGPEGQPRQTGARHQAGQAPNGRCGPSHQQQQRA